jgi:4-hydroxybenzoate polyprenyltransferase
MLGPEGGIKLWVSVIMLLLMAAAAGVTALLTRSLIGLCWMLPAVALGAATEPRRKRHGIS